MTSHSGKNKNNPDRAVKNAAARFTRTAVAAALCLMVYMLARLWGGPPADAPAAKIAQVGTGEGVLSVHFIDVGQGDAALLVSPDGSCMLIDAGPNSAEDELQAYLDALGVKKLEYVVFTHPHEDHIGGGDMIMREYKVERVIMPDAVNTTATFERLLDAIDESGAEVISADEVLGETFALSEGSTAGAGGDAGTGGSSGKAAGESGSAGASGTGAGADAKREVPAALFTVLGPCKQYDELNNTSVVLLLSFGEAEFLFTGDAEAESERDQLARFGPEALRCDVLKVGHHGSSTSTSEEYLSAAAPQLAVISCAKINDYGHPHRETLEKLGRAGVALYTTADYGTVVIRTDGKNIEAVTK